MPGERSLIKLLATLKPTLMPGVFVFATVESAMIGSLSPEILQASIMTFKEVEGLTLILPEELANEHAISYTYPSRQVVLDIHSSLEAVGFMAAISTRLARQGFSANPVSAYFHDHLFVKVEEADAVVDVLKTIQLEAAEETNAIANERTAHSLGLPS